mgnify:CR=1 FL=1
MSNTIKFNFLTTDEKERYQKHLSLKEIGFEGQISLKNSSVLCIGAGGLGSSVLIYMAVNERLFGKPEYLHDFPGLHVDAVHWLADKGIVMFGVEAISPAPEGEPNFKAHMACAERGITHMEGLMNLDQLIDKGRFQFIGFPLKIKGGTGSPIRAVAVV